jgi:hypothetical protein
MTSESWTLSKDASPLVLLVVLVVVVQAFSKARMKLSPGWYPILASPEGHARTHARAHEYLPSVPHTRLAKSWSLCFRPFAVVGRPTYQQARCHTHAHARRHLHAPFIMRDSSWGPAARSFFLQASAQSSMKRRRGWYRSFDRA